MVLRTLRFLIYVAFGAIVTAFIIFPTFFVNVAHQTQLQPIVNSRNSTTEGVIFPSKQQPSTKIFVITPTSMKRNAYKADLTRLSYTLSLVADLHWIVVEDNAQLSPVIEQVLNRSGVTFSHLAVKSDPLMQKKGRGMTQRNVGLGLVRYLHRNIPLEEINAVLYFADDDNTYDIRLFNDYIRNVQRVGIWTVAFPSNAFVEGPMVENNTVTGWDALWNPQRSFATDMAGFAIHVRLIVKFNDARFHEKCQMSLFEPCFLEQFNITKTDLEPFGFASPVGEREVLVWHTKTDQNNRALKGTRKGFIL